ncbi:hypothetical protein [Magnetococcus marinus]|uniref:hypothetical protein n=1 Tax=Magnetococcus marinus TaxID=1124597 RepID=UPI00118051D4|nr:hypothetical protein [Magnetococcus marinus]
MATQSIDRHLEPQLRLFLSVDVIGSTAFKQNWIDTKSNDSWFIFFESFFNDFHTKFKSCIADHAKEDERQVDRDISPWKFMGDEIIYSIEIKKSWQALFLLKSFRSAVIEHRNEIEDSRNSVSLKATAWLAGFPVGNSVVDTPTGEDYLGPLIDTGFRLSKFASREQMVISVDLAWYITKSDSRPDGFYLHGLETLKGVLGGRDYPIIWWDMDNALTEKMTSVGLLSKIDSANLNKYCECFIERAQKPLIFPFCPDDNERRPDGYDEDLKCIRKLRNSVPDDHPSIEDGESVDIQISSDKDEQAVKNAIEQTEKELNSKLS